jgi:hypothetical protein
VVSDRRHTDPHDGAGADTDTMGFQRSLTNTSPPPAIRLKVVPPDKFKLLTPFAYVGNGGAVYVPVHGDGEETDLASVPPFLWGLLASYGRQLRAALMHDRLCDQVKAMPCGTRKQRAAAYASRKRADDMFRVALRDLDGSAKQAENRVPWSRSLLFWAGVSAGRYWDFRKVRAVLLGLHVLVGTAALYWAALSRDPQWLWAYALVLALSVAWLKDWAVAAVGVLAGPVVLPPFAANAAAHLVLAVPDTIARLLHPGTEPKPRPRPTLKFS